MNIMNFDFDAFLITLKKVGIKIIKIPMDILNKLPPWVKTVFLVLIIIVTIAISIWWWKNREEWRHYKST